MCFLQSWKRFKQNLAEATYSLELWRGQIKNIEGKFGTGVTSYFMLLKFLFLPQRTGLSAVFCIVGASNDTVQVGVSKETHIFQKFKKSR